MARCVISNMPTENKWRGHYICKDFVEMAKAIRQESGQALRQCLIALQTQWRAKVAEEVAKVDLPTMPDKDMIPAP